MAEEPEIEPAKPPAEKEPEKPPTQKKPGKPASKWARSEQRLDAMEVPANPYQHKRRQRILDTPLSKEERARIDLLYRKNVALVKYMSAKMIRKYGAILEGDTILSLSQIAFIKSARVWDPNKGTLATVYGLFFNGEILHWVRSSNWGVRAPHDKRALGCKVRSLKSKGLSTAEVMQQLEIDAEQLKDVLLATNGVDHDLKGFDLHASPYPTPMEQAEEAEETEAMRERLIDLSAKRFGLTEAQAQAFVKQKLMQVEIFGIDKVG